MRTWEKSLLSVLVQQPSFPGFFIVAIYLPPSGTAGVRRTWLDQFFWLLRGK